MTLREINAYIEKARFEGNAKKVAFLEELKNKLYADRVAQAKAKNHEYKYSSTDFSRLDETKDGKQVISGKYLNIYLKMATDKRDAEKVELIKAEQKRRTKQARLTYKFAKMDEDFNKFLAENGYTD